MVDKGLLYEVEPDSSDLAIAATLNQNKCPVSFVSPALQGPEISHASAEEEANALIN